MLLEETAPASPRLCCVGVAWPPAGGVGGGGIGGAGAGAAAGGAAPQLLAALALLPPRLRHAHRLGANPHPHVTIWLGLGAKAADSNRVMKCAAEGEVGGFGDGTTIRAAALRGPLPKKLRGVVGCAVGPDEARVEIRTRHAWREWVGALTQGAPKGGGAEN